MKSEVEIPLICRTEFISWSHTLEERGREKNETIFSIKSKIFQLSGKLQKRLQLQSYVNSQL